MILNNYKYYTINQSTSIKSLCQYNVPMRREDDYILQGYDVLTSKDIVYPMQEDVFERKRGFSRLAHRINDT